MRAYIKLRLRQYRSWLYRFIHPRQYAYNCGYMDGYDAAYEEIGL